MVLNIKGIFMVTKSEPGYLRLSVPLLLPFIVCILVPFLLYSFFEVPLSGIQGLPQYLQVAVGVILIAIGFVGFLWTILLFARIGKGTLAPWDPTKKLVVAGPYAHVRNPMITSLIGVLVGEALLLSSWSILAWAVIAFMVNHIYFIFSEEPGLAIRFGEEYETYKKNVPRWLPRITPWRPTDK